MKHAIMASLAIFMVASAAAAQGDQVVWDDDMDLAVKRATTENKPIMIAFVMDGESANNEVARGHFKHPEVVKASKGFVCLIANLGAHDEDKMKTVEGADYKICKKFGCNGCAVHQRVDMRARAQFFSAAPILSAPQFLFLRSDGKSVLYRHVWMLSAAELAREMALAMSIFDPSKGGADAAKRKSDAEMWVDRAADNNAEKRKNAIRTLVMIEDEKVMDFLKKQTAEGVDESKRIEAIDALGRKGNGKAQFVLCDLLKTQSMLVRNHVVMALERLEEPECAPRLAAALAKEQKSQVKSNLVRALAKCDAVSPEFRKLIFTVAKTGAQGERMGALRAMGDMKMDDELKKVALASLDDQSPQIRGLGYWLASRQRIPGAQAILAKKVPTEKAADIHNLGMEALSMFGGPAYDGPSVDELFKHLLFDEKERQEEL